MLFFFHPPSPGTSYIHLPPPHAFIIGINFRAIVSNSLLNTSSFCSFHSNFLNFPHNFYTESFALECTYLEADTYKCQRNGLRGLGILRLDLLDNKIGLICKNREGLLIYIQKTMSFPGKICREILEPKECYVKIKKLKKKLRSRRKSQKG